MGANLRNNVRWMASADRLGSPARLANGSSTRNIAAALGELVKVAPEKPTISMAWATPGVASEMSEARRATASVRASDAPGGNCMTAIR